MSNMFEHSTEYSVPSDVPGGVGGPGYGAYEPDTPRSHYAMDIHEFTPRYQPHVHAEQGQGQGSNTIGLAYSYSNGRETDTQQYNNSANANANA